MFLVSMQSVLIEQNIPAPGQHLCGLAWGSAHLWLSDGDTNLIYQIDPTSGKVLGSIPCPHVRTDLSYDSGNLWQIAGHPKRIAVIDPQRATILKEIDSGPDREMLVGSAYLARTTMLDSSGGIGKRNLFPHNYIVFR